MLSNHTIGIYAYLYNYCGPFVIIGPNKSILTNVGSLISFVISHIGWPGPGVELLLGHANLTSTDM